MPPIALGLLLTAAALHTGWNLLVKRAREKRVFTWWALVVGAIGFAPLLALSPPPPPGVWPYVVASALAEAIYFVALAFAYQYGDFSLVYPLARGAAPAFLAVWAALFLGERPSAAGVGGLALLVLGLVTVGGGVWRAQRAAAGATSAPAALAALGVACCISIYSAIDGAAVRFANPLSYTVLVLGLTAAFVAPVTLLRYGRAALLDEWRLHWRSILMVGFLSMLAYILVLQAYSIARVSYAGAIREISVVFAALVGWRWLGEGFGALRTVGALLIFAGILVISLAG